MTALIPDMPVALGSLHPVYLLGDSLLDGDYTLSLSGDTGAFKIWPTDSTNGTPLLVVGQTVTNGMPVTFATAGGVTEVWLEAVSNGTVTVTFGFTGSDDAKGLDFHDTLNVKVTRFGMVPDYDRDGEINAADAARQPKPLPMWHNDDTDDGDIGTATSGIPNYSWNSANRFKTHVCGRDDLIDFFPVWLDVSELLKAEPGATLRLKHQTSGVNAVPTSLKADGAGDYLTVDPGTGYGPALGQPAHTATKLTKNGIYIELPPAFLNLIRNDPAKGVILIEGSGDYLDTNPLILEAVKDNAVIMTAELPLRISPVEDFFRWLNQRPNPAYPSRLGDPQGRPDSECIDKHVFFVHGFRVPEDEARAWSAKTFKKLYQSGMNAKFTGVTWYGDQGTAMDYYQNVINAFDTAPVLAQAVNDIVGENGQADVFMAHSLGNMLVSSAIDAWGMKVGKYFALNSAVAAEAFDTSTVNEQSVSGNQMLHTDWEGYDSQTWSACWHKLFVDNPNFPDDSRVNLTWRGRFSGVLSNTQLYNFWSSGDEIFELDKGESMYALSFMLHWPPWDWSDKRQYTWQKQEFFKGRSSIYGTGWAGWGFRKSRQGIQIYTMQEANDVASTNATRFIARPVFRRTPPEMLTWTYIPPDIGNQILAKGIPALSPPMGVTNIATTAGVVNFNMNSTNDVPRVNGWVNRVTPYAYGTRWLHSDLMYMAYFYTHGLYRKFVKEGGMDE